MRFILSLAAALLAAANAASLNPKTRCPAGAELFDAIIIGGGPGGLAVASGLARQRHSTLLFDSGEYRNAGVKYMHNVLGWDHSDPAHYRAKVQHDLQSYQNNTVFKHVKVDRVRRLNTGHFEVRDVNGVAYWGRKLALAQGVEDIPADIKGYKECWPLGIFHCLFCEGYEERDRESAGVLALDNKLGPSDIIATVYHVLQLDRTARVYTNGNETLARLVRGKVEAQTIKDRVNVETGRIAQLQLVQPGEAEVEVTLEDGHRFYEAFLAHNPEWKIRGDFHQQLNLTLDQSGAIKVDDRQEAVGMKGVFVAGDAGSKRMTAAYASMLGARVAVVISTEVTWENAHGKV